MGASVGEARRGSRPLLLAILGAGTISFSAIFVRAASVSPSTAAIFRCAYALPALGLLAWLARSRAAPGTRRRPALAVAAGVFLAIDLVAWHHSIADVGAGLATVLGNAQVAVIPLVAWAVHAERPDRRTAAMVSLAALGVVLVSGVLDQHAYGRHPATGAAFGAITAVTYSLFILLLRASSSRAASTIEPLLIATVTACVVAAILGVLVGDASFAPSWPAHAWLIALALTSQVLGWILIANSLPRLRAATTSLALTIQPVGSVILAAVIFGEDPGALQLLGALLILSSLSAVARKDGSGDVRLAIAEPPEQRSKPLNEAS
jgi:drug/metabolite transporter (DMT)-like permease